MEGKLTMNGKDEDGLFIVLDVNVWIQVKLGDIVSKHS